MWKYISDATSSFQRKSPSFDSYIAAARVSLDLSSEIQSLAPKLNIKGRSPPPNSFLPTLH